MPGENPLFDPGYKEFVRRRAGKPVPKLDDDSINNMAAFVEIMQEKEKDQCLNI